MKMIMFLMWSGGLLIGIGVSDLIIGDELPANPEYECVLQLK